MILVANSRFPFARRRSVPQDLLDRAPHELAHRNQADVSG
jgi:hypothetical protein